MATAHSKARGEQHGMFLHGHATKGHETPEYRAWHSMRERCRNPRCKGYHNYGGRGITVCERWRESFLNFLADVGARPSQRHTLGRIDNDGHYQPGNVRWETWGEQGSNRRTNRRVTHGGLTLTVSEWSRRTGLGIGCISHRLDVGWPVHDALTTPVNAPGSRWKMRKGYRLVD